MPTEAQNDALKKLGNPQIVQSFNDHSIDIMWEGQRLAMAPDGRVMTVGEYMAEARLKKEKAEKKGKKGKKEDWWKTEKVIVPYKPYVSVTPCQAKPELCEPRPIKHVAWDADDTIWEIKPYGIASSITGKLERVDPDTVVETREPWKPVAKTEQLPFEPEELTDQGLRFKYGYRYGATAGYEEEPEEFWYRQIDKMSAGKPAKELEPIMMELTEELSEKDKEFLGIIGKSVGEEVKLIEAPKPKKKKPVPKIPYATYEPQRLTIKLMPGYRDLLEKLREKGITNSIISLNTKGTVSRIIDTFGLTDHFIEIRDSWESKKKVFDEQMKTYGISPKSSIFIDNAQMNVEDVAKSGALPLVFGKDVKEVAQILNYMKDG